MIVNDNKIIETNAQSDLAQQETKQELPQLNKDFVQQKLNEPTPKQANLNLAQEINRVYDEQTTVSHNRSMI